ncbi:hypothetical protein D9M69_531650 [compost metagenome]
MDADVGHGDRRVRAYRPAAAVAELGQGAVRHEQEHHGLGLGACLQPDGASGDAVVAAVRAFHAQYARSVLGPHDEACAQHGGKHQHAARALHQLLGLGRGLVELG